MSAAADQSASVPVDHESQDSPAGSSKPVSNDSPGASNNVRTGKLVQNGQQSMKKSMRICRFYNTKAGCRAGDACRYQHVDTTNDHTGPPASLSEDLTTGKETIQDEHQAGEPGTRVRKLNKPQSSTPRVAVTKPVPRVQQTNPRGFQIGQVVRRFTPAREDVSGGTTVLCLNLVPSDPDFPFELDNLQCKLTVPSDWPSNAVKPTLEVQNSEIPKGYRINIERGFASLVSHGKTLLALLNDLDRNLEKFLASEKAQTIKIVANRQKPEPQAIFERQPTISVAKEAPKIEQPIWTQEQKSLANAKREADIRQLEARMGRLPLFSSSTSKDQFNIPINYPKPACLPVSLQPLKEVALHVPVLYNLEPCSIKVKGVYGHEAENVEISFREYASQHHDSTLMTLVNYLTQHLPDMATRPNSKSAIDDVATQLQPAKEVNVQESLTQNQDEVVDGKADQDRPHLIFMSRPPPEWNRGLSNADGSTDSSSEEYTTSGDDDFSADEEDIEGGASIPTPATSSNLEKGVLFSFPQLEMTGIELLEVNNLSLSVKCDRCKSTMDFKNIKPTTSTTTTTITRTETCNKCASPLGASYRSEPVHANSIKAGFLDLEGCTVQDMLPSGFTATCSECSSTQEPPGITTVRGDTALSVCRTCHKKMTLHIQEVKFLRVSSNDSRLKNPLAPRRKPKENLGITSGTPLVERGKCKHYAKSFRWFRFSCCDRVYPCDRCHDLVESHPNEHANRMICGWCSREQKYRPEDCQFCQRSVIRKTGGGFWEGGKGTRDRVKMNRNDPRKYKRIGGTNENKKKK